MGRSPGRGALLLCLALLLPPRGATAEEKADAGPTVLMHRGMAERRAGNYERAAAAFRRAFELSGEPNYLFLLAETQREAGLLKEALVSYRRYLELSPNAPDRQLARDQIEALEQQQIPPAKMKTDPDQAEPRPAGTRPALREELPAAPPPLTLGRAPVGAPEAVPVYRRPWLWIALGVVAAGGVALGLGLGLRPSAPSFLVAPGATP